MSDGDPVVRPAAIGEIDVIVRHRTAMWKDIVRNETRYADAAGMTDGEIDAASRAFLQPRMERGEWRHWFAVDAAGAVLSGAGLWIVESPPMVSNPSGRMAHIMFMYTEPPHRRKGLGRRLLAAILDWCAANDLRQVRLHASEKGRPLYEQAGFKASNEMRVDLP